MNAREELLEHINGRKVEFVELTMMNRYCIDREIKGTLAEVLPLLNFEYDEDSGDQKMDGYIWYTDGTWSDRSKYDGSEWWEHRVRPERS